MGKNMKNFFTINNLLIFLSILSIISSNKRTLLQSNFFLRKLQDNNYTDLINTSDITNETTIEISIPTTIPTNGSEVITNIGRRKKNGGLSAGGIIGIIIPCVAAAGGAAAASFALRRNKNASSSNNNAAAHDNYNSSMTKFNTNNIQVNNNGAIPVKEVQVIQQTPEIQEHPIYPIKKEEIPVPKNNNAFETIQPVEKPTPINPLAPTQNMNQEIASQVKLVPGANTINTTQQMASQNVISTTNPSTQVIPVV